MLEAEAARRQAGDPRRALKYFGKWPFMRVAGAQELLSSLLSLANLVAHVHCW